MVKSTTNVKTRLFIISDTHDGFQGSTAQPYSQGGSFRPPLPKADVLLHSGDLTMIGTIQQYRNTLAMLKDIDAELKLVIAGNHDLSLHEDYYRNDKMAQILLGQDYDSDTASQAKELWTGPEAKSAGVTYLTEGLYTFNLSNGAEFTIYASPWQPEFCGWAFNYPHNQDRWNPPHLVSSEPSLTEDVVPAPAETDPKPIPEGAQVDIVMTHGPPYMHLDDCASGNNAGCPHLLKALDRVRPRLHCFGHIHEAWGAELVVWKKKGEEAQSGELGKLVERAETYAAIIDEDDDVQSPRDEAVIERRAAYIDVSGESKRPLQHGRETLLVNSCIMDLRYRASNAGFVVDIDLPRKDA